MSETVRKYVQAYGSYAIQSEIETGIPAIFSLAQSALESGWGKSVKGNNMFGIKDTDGINGNEISFITTEYSKKTGWHKIKAWFRKYRSPKESFNDHGRFLRRNKRYYQAMEYTDDPIKFAKALAAAGYATDPNYAGKIIDIMAMIKPYFKQL